MINIMIIGLGSIGSRHLESILKINKNKNIFLIDPKYNSNNQTPIPNISNAKILKFSKNEFLIFEDFKTKLHL